MSRTPTFRPDAVIGSLRTAQKMIKWAVLLQFPLMLAYLVHWQWLDRAFPWLILAVVLLSCLGFVIVDRQLGVFGAALDAMPDLITQSAYNRATIAKFMLLFLVFPVANWLVLAFTYFRASDAIQEIERVREDMKAKARQAAQLRSGPSDAFRTAPARAQN